MLFRSFRIEAILRRVRGKKNKESNIYKIGMFTFDTQKQILSTPEKQTKLTTKESELLGLLCAHANEILRFKIACTPKQEYMDALSNKFCAYWDAPSP